MERKIKFLINISLKVDLESDTSFTCQHLLEHLKNEGFRNEENEESSLGDLAVILGLNGKYSSKLSMKLEELQELCEVPDDIKYSKITFTWGEGGDIATAAADPPYQDIREHLKNHDDTQRFVREMRDEDPTEDPLIYFSFVDADTLNFNHIYSEYVRIVREELAKDGIPPTVMSTGYEFDSGSDFHIASHLDRLTRVATARCFPLGTYYPEPNFCVLVPDDEDHVPESFIDEKRKNMESPVLITQVKMRKDFKAVFPDTNPIIIDVPQRFNLTSKGLKTNQSHLAAYNWAVGVYANGELQLKGSCRGITGKSRGYLKKMLKKSNDEIDRAPEDKEFPFVVGPAVPQLIEAAKQSAEFINWVYDFDDALEEDEQEEEQ